MTENRRSGKLAVILHADIAGSTALVQQDEHLAHERIQDSFRLFSDTISKYHGRVCELRGDALLAEFDRASDSVTAALAFQEEHTEHIAQFNDNIQPTLRVGIAMGEVVIADNTVTGTGVVLAQRVEQLAEPGGVSITAAIHEALPQRMPFDLNNLGEHEVKGFDEQVRLYAVSLNSGATIPEPEALPQAEAEVPSLPDRPSIAVLPFDNMSGDSEQEYFSDGITVDIITELSRFRSLFVIASNSSFHYKGQFPNILKVGNELGVQFVVEGSVRKAENRVRVTAQLSDTEYGIQIWAERYDRKLEDVFDVQDELVRTIVSTVGGRIEDAGKTRVERRQNTNTHTYDLYLRARAAQDRNTREDYQQAFEYLKHAIELDPGFAQAHLNLSLVLFMQWMAHWIDDRNATFQKSMTAAKQALALDPTDSSNYSRLGTLYLNQRQFDEAGQNFRKAVFLNPNDSQSIALYGTYWTAVGKPERGVEQFDEAIRLNPFEPNWFRWSRGIANFTAQNYEDAIADFTSLNKPINEARGWLAATYAHAGKLDKARQALEEFLEAGEKEMAAFPGGKLENWQDYWHGAIEYESEALFEHLYDGLLKAGLSN